MMLDILFAKSVADVAVSAAHPLNIPAPGSGPGYFIVLLLGLILAPLLPGIINKVKAFFAGRRGPSIFQLYYDLFKLFRKGSFKGNTASRVFTFAPAASLISLIAASLLLPLGLQNSPFAFAGDFILFVYLLGFGRVMTILGALDTGSSFEGMGAAREMLFSALAEGVFLAVFAFLFLLTGSFSLSGELTVSNAGSWIFRGTPLVLIGIAFFLLMLSECCRVPFDDPETHLELTMIHEAMVLDYGGFDLGAVLYGASVKLYILASFLVLLLLPQESFGTLWNGVFYFAGVILMAVVIGIVESIMARFRFLKVPQLLNGALVLSVIAIIFMVVFER